MKSRPRILIMSDFYLPGYKSGGGMRTVVNTVERLRGQFEFFILTRDHDGFGDLKPYEGIEYASWNRVGAASVRYLRPSEIRLRTISGIISELRPDAIYFNSIFSTLSILFFLARLIGGVPPIPVGVAPCGELSDGAMKKGRIKKRIFLSIAKLLRFHQGVYWRASDDAESAQISDWMDSADVTVAPDISVPLAGTGQSRLPKTSGSARLVFFSRIVPKKNLEFLLKIMATVKGDLTLQVIGPIEDESYGTKLREIASRLPVNKRVEFTGPVPYETLSDRLTHSDLFVFPTLGENFGHVIAEALSASCPVLVSDQTPWQSLNGESAGFVIPLDRSDEWVEVLEKIIAMDDVEHSALRSGALNLAHRIFSDETVANRSREFFTRLASYKDSVS
jgi:glycosyltransferase involved in cell wall biosynthesis